MKNILLIKHLNFILSECYLKSVFYVINKFSFIKASALLLMACISFLPTLVVAQNIYSTVWHATASSTPDAGVQKSFVLTPDVHSHRGAVWNTTPIRLDASFDFSFKVFLGSKDGDGADGIAFVLQTKGTTAIGAYGSGLGYGGITPSLAVEYDTWYSGNLDPREDHIAIHKNGDFYSSYEAVNNVLNIEDGQWHTTRIIWSAASQKLTVFFDGVEKMTYTDNIEANIFGNSKQIYWGFTGATGNNSNLQMFSVEQLNFPDALTVDVSATPVSCASAADGSVAASYTGGITPVEFMGWNTGEKTTTINNVEPGIYIASFKDGANNIVSKSVTVAVSDNAAPVIQDLKGPTDPVSKAAAAITMSAKVTEKNLTSIKWTWGDGSSNSIGDNSLNQPTMIYSPETNSYVVTGSHTFLAAGVYPVTLTVTDVCGDTDTENFEYVVVYDPEGGFVTGGGWIYSPPSAYLPDGTLEGNASFGFVSKYKKGATIPEGQTQFQFHAGNMNFHSSSYEWLVVSGYKAQYKGEGTINGNGGYSFLLSAVDGAKKSSTEPDRLRIKIWIKESGILVYDNQFNAAEDAEASTAINKGSIVIHNILKSSSTSPLTAAADMKPSMSLLGKFYNYPNTFSDRTTVAFALEKEEHFTLEVYDMKGSLVQKIETGLAEAGKVYEFQIDGTKLKDGMFIARLATNSKLQSLKMLHKSR